MCSFFVRQQEVQYLTVQVWVFAFCENFLFEVAHSFVANFFRVCFQKMRLFFFLEVVATSMRKFGKFVLETGCFFFLLSLYICEKVCRLCFRTVKKFGEFVWKRGLFFLLSFSICEKVWQLCSQKEIFFSSQP